MSKRFERTPRKYIHFTQKDGLTLQAVFFARYITNQQICRLLYSPTTFSWCKQRLRYLYDQRYLAKRDRLPNQSDIYDLDRRGRNYIARTVEGYSQEQVDKIAGA